MLRNKKFKSDYFRWAGKYPSFFSFLKSSMFHEVKYLYNLRRKKGIIKKIKEIHYARKYGLEILSSNIGEGLYLGHAYNITVSPMAIIGKNCNLNKGCTIGKENRGVREGAPWLGDSVWVGSNAVIVGNVKIGDDVLIAPNSYVNFDVPSHSIVVGNPGVIKHSENATNGYICNKV